MLGWEQFVVELKMLDVLPHQVKVSANCVSGGPLEDYAQSRPHSLVILSLPNCVRVDHYLNQDERSDCRFSDQQSPIHGSGVELNYPEKYCVIDGSQQREDEETPSAESMQTVQTVQVGLSDSRVYRCRADSDEHPRHHSHDHHRLRLVFLYGKPLLETDRSEVEMVGHPS